MREMFATGPESLYLGSEMALTKLNFWLTVYMPSLPSLMVR